MELFEEIYRNARLLRLQEARALNTVEEIYKALKKDASGRRYIETLLNGKKNLPEWFRTLADYDNLDLIKQPLEALLNRFKNDQKGNVNYAICLLFRKSDSIDKLKEILKDSMDTLVQYANNAKTQWISKLDTYDDVMTKDYNPEIWHDFEKDIQDFKVRKNATKGKELSNEDKDTLYDTLYEDNDWGLYVPKSFEGDSELASHIKEFQNDSKTYNKTQWCTAADSSYFDSYSYNGNKPLYVIKYFENGVYTEAWQIAFMREHIELMDKRDERNFDFLFKNAPKELFNKIIDTSNETESYIFPFLVEKYNKHTGIFELDSTYSVYCRILLDLPTVSEDVKSMIGKEVSLEELIDFREVIFGTSNLDILIKEIINLKNKGYPLELTNNVIGALGIKFNDLEECLEGYIDFIKGNFSLEELGELKELRKSMGYIQLDYSALKRLIRLKEKGYSLKYLSDVSKALDLENVGALEECIDSIKGQFSLDELAEIRFIPTMKIRGHLRQGGLDFLIRLKEKGYSIKYISAANRVVGSRFIESLEGIIDFIKENFSLEELEELLELRASMGRYFFMSNDLERIIRLKEKGYSIKYLKDICRSHGFESLEDLEKAL